MTINTNKKKLVRERMSLTGETYLVAARNLDLISRLMPTPWARFNTLIGGFRPGAVHLFGGHAGHGISVISDSLTSHLAQNGEHVIRLTSLSGHSQPSVRVQKMATQSYTKYDEKFLALQEKAISQLHANVTYLPWTDTMAELVRAIKAVHAKRKVTAVIIDSLPLTTYFDSIGDRDNAVVEFKKLMKELDATGILFAFPNNGADDKSEAQLSNFYQGKILEATVDTAVILTQFTERRYLDGKTDLYIKFNLVKNSFGETDWFSVRRFGNTKLDDWVQPSVFPTPVTLSETEWEAWKSANEDSKAYQEHSAWLSKTIAESPALYANYLERTQESRSL